MENRTLLYSLLGATVLGVLIYSAKAESKIQNNAPPPPPPPPPPPLGPPPYGGASLDAGVAAAMAAAMAASQPGPQNAGFRLLPDPVPLTQGRTYKARVELSGLQTLASNDMVKASFEGLGFSNVRVISNPIELVTANWPPEGTFGMTPNTRWIEGVWNQPSQTIPKPSEIQSAWEVL